MNKAVQNLIEKHKEELRNNDMRGILEDIADSLSPILYQNALRLLEGQFGSSQAFVSEVIKQFNGHILEQQFNDFNFKDRDIDLTGAVEIGEGAFGNDHQTGLMTYHVPETVKEIGDRSFTNCRVFCKKGSYCDKWGKENSIWTVTRMFFED